MASSLERPSSASGQSEGHESPPPLKHEIRVEKESTSETEQRKEWLREAFPIQQKDASSMDWSQERKREYAYTLDVWAQDLPYYGETIAALRQRDPHERDSWYDRPQSITSEIYRAHDKGDQDKLRQYQELGRGLVHRYDGRAEGKQWQDLPEEHKRYVRFGEMTVLMVDTLRALRNLRERRRTPHEVSKLSDILTNFSDSADIPDDFSNILVKALQNRIYGIEKPKPKPDLELNPWEGGTMLNALGAGSSPTEQDLWEPLQRFAEAQASPPPPGKIVVEQIKNPADGISRKGQEGTVIDTELNPKTGIYEPIGEQHNPPSPLGKPQRLTHEPKVPPPNVSGGSATRGPEAPPSAPSAPPAPASPPPPASPV